MHFRDRTPAAAFLGASLIWGSTFLVIRIGNETVPPLWAVTLRLALACILLVLFMRVTRAVMPRGDALAGAALFGFFQFGVNFALLYWGELTVPSGIAAVFYATIPLSSALFAWAFGVERAPSRKVVAALVAVAGVAMIFGGELSLEVPLAGLLAILGAATSASLGNVFLKRAPPQAAVPANVVGTAIGAVFCGAVSLAMGEAHMIPRGMAAWGPILYLTLLGSLGAFLMMTWLIRVWSVVSVGFIPLIVTVVALALGAVVRDERPAVLSLVGAAVVIAAVLIALRARPGPRAQST